jgi:hypothetical protein
MPFYINPKVDTNESRVFLILLGVICVCFANMCCVPLGGVAHEATHIEELIRNASETRTTTK